MLTIINKGRVVKTIHLLKTWRSCTTAEAASTHGYTSATCTQSIGSTPTVAANIHCYMTPRVEKNVVYSPVPQMELPQEDIPSLIFSRAKRWAHKDAIECGVTGRKYSYGGMVDRALRWGAVVSHLLASPSSTKTLAIFCTNAPEFPILLLGTLAVGASVTTVSTSYTAEEVARQLEDSGSEVIVTDSHLEQVVTEALAKLNKTVPIFVNGASSFGHPNLRHIIEDTTRPFAKPVKSDLRAAAVIAYSSGTTGKPKGVVQSHGAITACLSSFTHPDFYSHFPNTAEVHDTVTGVLPFYHVSGLLAISLSGLYLGKKIVSLPSFNPQDFIRIIKDHKVGVLHLVPPMMKFLVSSPMVTADHLAGVRSVICGAAPVPTSTAQAFKEKAPNPVIIQEAFGMTESLVVFTTPIKEERLGWCGKCVPCVEAKVVDTTTGEALPEGHRGELCTRSPMLMTHYLNNPTATAETIDADGWLHTGDIAIHQDGFFSIVDRMKELIKVKGFQVSPSELEDLLLKHPAVTDVGVVGVEDERAGELPRAYVVCQENVTEEELHKFLEPRVAEYKKLKGGIRFVDSLPKNATGKILRKDLKAMAAKDA